MSIKPRQDRSLRAARIAPAVAVLALLLSGCSALQIEPPDITLVNLEFTDLTLFETTGVFTIRLTNADRNPLVVDGGVYTVFLNGMKVGKGVSPERFEVPGLESSTHEVTMHLSNLALMRRIAELMEEPLLDYRVKSKLWLVTNLGTRRATFTHDGRIDLSRLDRGAEELSAPGFADPD